MQSRVDEKTTLGPEIEATCKPGTLIGLTWRSILSIDLVKYRLDSSLIDYSQ